MPVLPNFVAFESAARRVRNRHLAAAFMALSLAAAVAPSAWAAGTQNQATPHGAPAVATQATSPSELNPDGTMPTAVVKAGVETRALRAWDCGQPDRAPIVWARADHGTISVKPITSEACGRLSMTVAGIFYISEPGFKGRDKVYLLGFLSDGKYLDQTFTILVK